jgi:beta-aspartyl-dipeptidase (metallo-type)
MRLEDVLPLVTTNTARVLQLPKKGRLTEGADADVAVVDARSLELRHVVARGKILLRDGSLLINDPGLPPERSLRLAV